MPSMPSHRWKQVCVSEQSWSKGLQLLSDVTEADWLLAALAPWELPMAARSLVPAVFPAYARVLPSAEIKGEVEGRRWRWREIAQRTGAGVHAEARYYAVSGGDRQSEAAAPQPWGVPWDRALPPQETLALATALSAFTSTPHLRRRQLRRCSGPARRSRAGGRPPPRPARCLTPARGRPTDRGTSSVRLRDTKPDIAQQLGLVVGGLHLRAPARRAVSPTNVRPCLQTLTGRGPTSARPATVAC